MAGSDPTLKRFCSLGTWDVVPVEPGTEDEWQQAPFGGRISDGYIWGRGAIDNKSTVLGTLEAVEMLLADGFRPTRTVYLAYGHDEGSAEPTVRAQSRRCWKAVASRWKWSWTRAG